MTKRRKRISGIMEMTMKGKTPIKGTRKTNGTKQKNPRANRKAKNTATLGKSGLNRTK